MLRWCCREEEPEPRPSWRQSSRAQLEQSWRQSRRDQLEAERSWRQSCHELLEAELSLAAGLLAELLDVLLRRELPAVEQVRDLLLQPGTLRPAEGEGTVGVSTKRQKRFTVPHTP